MERDQKRKTTRRASVWLRRAVLLAACLLFFGALYELIQIWNGYEAGRQEYDAIRDEVKQTVARTEAESLETEPQPESIESSGSESSAVDFSAYERAGTIMGLPGVPLVNLIAVRYDLIDFEKLRQMNPDVVAWITIEGTNIDYPVLYSPTSNDTYLRTTLTGEFNNAGSIFVDYRVQHPFGSQNTLIHGHNQRNKMMFHELSYYVDESFFWDHRQILIYLPSGTCTTYEIYSFYRSDRVSPTYDCSYVGGEYQQYLDYSKEQSWYDTGVTLTMEDRIITLSTCTNEWDDGRYVVHARKIS